MVRKVLGWSEKISKSSDITKTAWNLVREETDDRAGIGLWKCELAVLSRGILKLCLNTSISIS